MSSETMPHFNTPTQQRAVLQRIAEAEAAMLPPDWRDGLPAEAVSKNSFQCCNHQCNEGRDCPKRPAPVGRTLSDVVDDVLMFPIIVVGWLLAGWPFQ